MHIKFPPNEPSETPIIMNAKLRLPGSSHGPGMACGNEVIDGISDRNGLSK